MKRKGAIILIFGCVFLALILIENFWGDRIYKKRFVKFNNSSINGRVGGMDIDKGFANIFVGNQSYKFVPVSINKSTDFLLFAEKGDSIFKPAKADTLKLIHHGKTYLYKFERF